MASASDAAAALTHSNSRAVSGCLVHTQCVALDLTRAFPPRLISAAADAAEGLGDHALQATKQLINETPRKHWGDLVLDGDILEIPARHYFPPVSEAAYPAAESVRQAWLTRSNDGYIRHRSLSALISKPARWHVPFVVQLCGEYVVEICVDVADYARLALPKDRYMINAYASFWRSNPQFIELTRARATSYWAEYGRSYRLADWPAMVALNQIEALIA